MSDFAVKAAVEIDGESMARGVSKLRGTMERTAAKIGGTFRERILGALGAAGATFVIKETLRKGFETQTAATKLGVDPMEFQTLKRLADQTGASVEDLGKKYVEAKLTGGSFAKEVQAAMADLVSQGLITTTDEIGRLSKAFVDIADVMQKLAPVIAGGVGALAGTVEKVTGDSDGMIAGYIGQWSRGLLVMAGRSQEAFGNLFGKGNWTEAGLARQLRAYGIAGQDQGKPGSKPSGSPSETSWDKLLREMRERLQFEAEWEAMGGNTNWTSSTSSKSKPAAANVSDLMQIGGYMSSGATVSPVETQLQLINRKLDDLVGAAHKATL